MSSSGSAGKCCSRANSRLKPRSGLISMRCSLVRLECSSGAEDGIVHMHNKGGGFIVKGFVNLSTRLSRHGVTTTDRLECAAPYAVMYPFRSQTGTRYVIMSSSAGLLEGDETLFDLRFGPGTTTEVRTQSYEKVLDTGAGLATKSMRIRVEEAAYASVIPFPTIPFDGSTLRSDTHIEIDPSATLIFAEATSCGRVLHGEHFGMASYSSKVDITVAGTHVLRDVVLLDPQRFSSEGIGQWGEFTHSATAYVHMPRKDGVRHAEQDLIGGIRGLQADDATVLIGATHAIEGVYVRIMAASGQRIMGVLEQIEALLAGRFRADANKGFDDTDRHGGKHGGENGESQHNPMNYEAAQIPTSAAAPARAMPYERVPLV